MTETTHREYDLAVGGCVVMQLQDGAIVVLTINEIGIDLDGEPIVQYDLWSAGAMPTVRFAKDGEHRHQLWDSDGQLVSNSIDAYRTEDGQLTCSGWVRLWYITRFLISKSTRHEIYFPVLNELVEDLHCDRAMSFSKRERVLVDLAFALRTVRVVIDCLYVDMKKAKFPWRKLAYLFGGGAAARVFWELWRG